MRKVMARESHDFIHVGSGMNSVKRKVAYKETHDLPMSRLEFREKFGFAIDQVFFSEGMTIAYVFAGVVHIPLWGKSKHAQMEREHVYRELEIY